MLLRRSSCPRRVQRLARNIRLLALDVDGVLTDGALYLGAEGGCWQRFWVQDGQGLKMVQARGIEIVLISGRRSAATAARAAELGIQEPIQGREDKLAVLEELLPARQLSLPAVAYVGDDLPDLPALRSVGLGVAVANAHPLLRRHAAWCTRAEGGRGAVREVCELLLRAQKGSPGGAEGAL